MNIIAKNKKAFYEYFINDTLEAGIVLNGDEVKSLRQGKVSINEAFAETENGELWLKKKDISTFQGKVEREGYTIVPIKIYFNKKGIAKVEIAVAKGKKLYDKREDKKQKDWNKQKQRLLRNFK